MIHISTRSSAVFFLLIFEWWLVAAWCDIKHLNLSFPCKLGKGWLLNHTILWPTIIINPKSFYLVSVSRLLEMFDKAISRRLALIIKVGFCVFSSWKVISEWVSPLQQTLKTRASGSPLNKLLIVPVIVPASADYNWRPLLLWSAFQPSCSALRKK